MCPGEFTICLGHPSHLQRVSPVSGFTSAYAMCDMLSCGASLSGTHTGDTGTKKFLKEEEEEEEEKEEKEKNRTLL